MTYITINLFKTAPTFLFLLLLILYSTIRQTKTNFISYCTIYNTRTNNRSLPLAHIYSFSLYYIYNKQTKTNRLVFSYIYRNKETNNRSLRSRIARRLSLRRSRSLSRLYILLYIITLRVLSINTIYKYYTITARIRSPTILS